MNLRRLLFSLIGTLATVAHASPGVEIAPPEHPFAARLREYAEQHRVTLPLFTASAARAESLLLWEGLPHPLFERELFEREKARNDHWMLRGEALYSKAIRVKPADIPPLRDLLTAPASYAVYGGPKFCGGFHADYAVEWSANDKIYRALVCLGCHELKLVSDDIELNCDLPKDTYDKLAALLKPYARSRPPRR